MGHDVTLPNDRAVCAKVLEGVRYHRSPEPLLKEANAFLEYWGVYKAILIFDSMTPRKTVIGVVAMLERINFPGGPVDYYAGSLGRLDDYGGVWHRPTGKFKNTKESIRDIRRDIGLLKGEHWSVYSTNMRNLTAPHEGVSTVSSILQAYRWMNPHDF